VNTAIGPDRPPSSTLFYFLLLSLAVHAALLMWLRGASLSIGDVEPRPLVVKLAPAPPEPRPPARPATRAQAPAAAQPSAQIVAPSDQENQLPPDGRAFLSDRDNRVDRETIRRGNPEAGTQQQQPAPQVASAPRAVPPPAPRPAPEPAAKAPPAKAPQPKPQRPAAQAREPKPSALRQRGDTMPQRLPGLDQLFAPPAEVLAKAEMERRAAGEPAPRGAADDPRKDLVSAPPPAPGLFGGVRGSFDALPDVAQGNLTMLNTKADRFAPFVRRVGTRVFQNLLIYQRQNLEASDILAANDIVTARVILDASGKLKSLEVDEHSGSMAVDQTLVDALRQAAFDDNPPKSAANENGEYEFVFQAQLLAGVGPGARGPELRTVESRLRIGLL
jgi:outer membrane biosynthesis protein TonB